MKLEGAPLITETRARMKEKPMETNALMIPQPQLMMRQATDVAGVSKAIVLKTAQNIQGRKYVRVEGWQAIAIAHGCTLGADQVRQIEGGIAARGIVRRMSDGVVIADAEGFVGDDEATWAKRPVFSRRAMAQTRAMSRAARSAFAHVVVMIDSGLMTTPAEEMGDGDHDDAPPAPQPAPGARFSQPAPAPAPAPVPKPTTQAPKPAGLQPAKPGMSGTVTLPPVAKPAPKPEPAAEPETVIVPPVEPSKPAETKPAGDIEDIRAAFRLASIACGQQATMACVCEALGAQLKSPAEIPTHLGNKGGALVEALVRLREKGRTT